MEGKAYAKILQNRIFKIRYSTRIYDIAARLFAVNCVMMVYRASCRKPEI